MSIVGDVLSRDEDSYEFVVLYVVRWLDWDSMLVQQSILIGPVLSSPMLVQQSVLNSPKRSVVGDAWIGESLYGKL